MRNTLTRILFYLVLGFVWMRQGWPAWSFLIVGLVVMFVSRFIGRETL